MFVGMTFLTIGLCAAAASVGFDRFFSDGFAAKFWPLILIGLGLGMTFRYRPAKSFFFACAGCIAGLSLYSGFILTRQFADKVNTSAAAISSPTQVFKAPYQSSLRESEFGFSGGAVSIVSGDTTDELFIAKIESTLGDYQFENKGITDSSRSLYISMPDSQIGLSSLSATNKAEIKLNEAPLWDLNFEIGAAAAHLDLRKYRIRSLNISSGASKLNLQLGNRSDSSEIHIEGGAMEAQVEIPDSSGCKVVRDDALSSFSFDEAAAVDDDTWQTPNYETAQHKIIIYIEAGVSKFTIRRAGKQ